MKNNLSVTLKEVGLTNQETTLYVMLLEKGALHAKDIAKASSILPNAIYRTIYQLNKKGFVTLQKNYPVTFQAVAPEKAISHSVEKQIRNLQRLTETLPFPSPLPKRSSYPTDIDLLYGKETIFEEAAKLLDRAKQEMLVISIGEPIPPNLLLSVKNANARGVTINMIVHKYDKDNKPVLENLKKNGYVIRYSPGWGFHVAIYDREKSFLIVNNPEHTDERAAMFIRSPGLSKALSDYFHATWQKAKTV